MPAKRRQYVATDKPEVHGPTSHTSLGGTPGPVLSTSNVAGAATTYLRTNDQLAIFDATAPTTSASGDAAAAGSAAFAARRDHTHGRELVITKFDFGSSGAQTTGTGALRLYNRTGRTLTIYGVNLALGTAPTGTTSTPVTNATFVVDVNINGTTIWGTQSQRACIIPATDANVGYFTTFGTTTIADGSYFTWDRDFVGSTIAGSDATLQIFCKG